MVYMLEIFLTKKSVVLPWPIEIEVIELINAVESLEDALEAFTDWRRIHDSGEGSIA